MANPQLVIRIIANTAELIANLNAGRGAIEAYGPSVAKMQASWQTHGAKVVEQAALITAALKDVQLKTLTAGDAARNLKALEAGMAQLAKEGKPIPPLMQHMAEELRRVEAAAKPVPPLFARVATAAQQLDKAAMEVGMRMQSLGMGLSIAITAPLVALGGVAIKSAMDFESSFAGVRKTVDATEEQFGELAQGFRNLSKEIPINVNELNKIGEAAGQLGIKTENILGFTRVMADLGVTTNLSSDQAATALARLANITQMPQDQFDRLGSTIVDLGNNFATTEAEIVEFGLRIAGAGTQAGLSEADILSIGAAMSSVGVEAEAGGTAVQKVLLKMVEASAKGGDAFGVFAATAGMSAQQFAKMFEQDAAGAFQAFVEGLGRQGKHAITTLTDLDLTDQRLIRSFLALSGAGDLLGRTLETGSAAWQANTALTIEAEKRYATFQSQLILLKNRVQDVAIEFGTALLPIFLRVVAVVERSLPALESLVKWFTSLPQSVQTTAVGLAALFAAIGPVLYIGGQLVLAIGALSGMLAYVLNPALLLTAGHHHGAAAATHVHTGAMATSAAGASTLVARLGVLSGAHAAVALVTAAHASALRLYAGIVLAASLNANVLITRLSGTAIAMALSSAAAHTATVAKGLFAAAMNTISGSAIVMGARLYASAAATTAVTIASRAAAIGVTALGVALTAVQYVLLPLIVGFVAFKSTLALLDWTGASDKVEYFSLRLRGVPAELAALTIESRRALEANKEIAPAFDSAAESAKRLRDQVSGVALAKDMAELSKITRELGESGQLPTETLKRIATAAMTLRDQGQKLSPELANIVTWFERLHQAIPPVTFATDEQKKAMEKAAQAATKFRESVHQIIQPMSVLGFGALPTVADGAGKVAAAFFESEKAMTGIPTQFGAVAVGANFAASAVEKVGVSLEDIVSAAPMATEAAAHFGEGWQAHADRALQAIDTVLSGIRSKVAETVVVVARAVRTIIQSLAEGDWLTALVAGIAAVIQVFKDAFGPTQAFQVRQLRGEFIEASGGIDAIAKEAQLAGASLDKLFNAQRVKDYEIAQKNLEQALKNHRAQIEQVGEAAEFLTKRVTAGTIQNEADFNRLGGFITQVFGNTLMLTGSLTQALTAVGPALDVLIAKQVELGIEGETAIRSLMEIREVVLANQDVMDSIDGLTGMMGSLFEAGQVNAAQFQAFAVDAGRLFEILIDRGVNADMALALMAPTLQVLWEQQRRFGLVTDDTTAALLQQAEEQGLVGESMMSVNERIFEVLLAIADVFGAKLPASLQTFQASAQVAGDTVVNEFDRMRLGLDEFQTQIPTDITIPIDFVIGDVPDMPTFSASGSVQGFAEGTRGRFLDFGRGTPVVLHNRERIVTEREGRAEAISTAAMESRLASIERLLGRVMDDQPRRIGVAVHDALVLGGRA